MGKDLSFAFSLLLSSHCIFCVTSGYTVNLQVSELGTDSVSVTWNPTQDKNIPAEVSISPADDGESASPQFFNGTYAMWSNLVSGKTYTVEVRHGSKASLPALLTITTVPASPNHMRIKTFVNPIMNQFRITGSKTIMYPVYGVVVSWDQPGGGQYEDFLLTISPAHGSIRVPVKLKSGLPAQENTEPRRIVWDLLPGVLYEFTVRSKSNSILSNPLTGAERMPPETPGPITVEEIAPTFVVLSWDGEHRGILDGFAIETDPKGGVAFQVHDDPRHPRRRVENLIPGTKYKIEIFSTMSGLRSFKPRVVQVNTLPATPRNKVRSEEVRAESVFITWNPPPGRMDYYEIVYYPTDRDFGRLRQRVWEPRINLTTLNPGSAYQTEIYAISNELISDPLKEIVHTRPLPPNAVITTATQDTIEISWETQNDDGGAVITYAPDDGEVITERLDPGINEFSITELDPDTGYIITLTTIKNGVESNPVIQTITTNQTPPSDNIPTLPGIQATEKDPTNSTAIAETLVTTALKTEALVAETEAEPEDSQTKAGFSSTLPVFLTSSYAYATTGSRREKTIQSEHTTSATPSTTRQMNALLPSATTVEATEKSVETTTRKQTTPEQTTPASKHTLQSWTSGSSAYIKLTTTVGKEWTTDSSTLRSSTASTKPSILSGITTRSKDETTGSISSTDSATTQRSYATTKDVKIQSQATSSQTRPEKTTPFLLLPPTETMVPPGGIKEFSSTSTMKMTTNVATSRFGNTIAEQENSTMLETISIKEGFRTFCNPSNITVLVDKAIIAKYEENNGPLHFNKDDSQSCRSVEHEGYYRYTIAPNILGCGTQFTVNETHVNFTNTVSNRQRHDEWYRDMLDDSGNIMIGRTNINPYPLVIMNFYCTFPLEMTVHTNLIPDLRVNILTFNVSGVGQFTAAMQLFQDEEYRHPHFAAPSIGMDDWLRVGVTLLRTKDDNISIAVRKCWATPVNDPDYNQFYPLIDEYCPLKAALNGKLTILENGKSKMSRWEGPMFKFVKFPNVWLHCEVKVCFGDQCNKVCSNEGNVRKRRAFTESKGAVVSAGPLSRKSSKVSSDIQDNSLTLENSKLEDTAIIIIVSVLSAVALIMCALFVVVFAKCRRRSRCGKEEEAIACPDSIASSTLENRKSDSWDTGRYAATSSPVHNPGVNSEMLPAPNVQNTDHLPENFDAFVENENNCYVNFSMNIFETTR